MAATDLAQSLRPQLTKPSLRPARLAQVGSVLFIGSVSLAAAGATADAAFGRALLQALVVGVPLAAGLYALGSPASARFGVALVAFSFAWSLTALGEASGSIAYTIGRTAIYMILPSVYYLLLIFPDGLLKGRLDRFLFRSIVAIALVLFLGAAFFVEAYPVHTPWATCVTDCPSNALFVLDKQPAIMGDVIVPLREYMIEVLNLLLIFALARRFARSGPLRRRMLGPVLFAGALMAGLQIAFYTARQQGAPAEMVETLGSIWTLALVGVVAACLFGLFWRRMLLTGVLTKLGGALRRDVDSTELQAALAEALSDPTTELVSERPATLSEGRIATTIGGDVLDGSLVLVHDEGLSDDAELLEAVTALVLAARRNEQLVATLTKSMAELEESRHRIAETADVERARIQRDLHDGAQQRLIALRIKLSLAEETLRDDPAAGAATIHELGFEAERALHELRSLAQGVYPPLLLAGGIEMALRDVVRVAPIDVRLTVRGVTRHSLEIESAVYFVCAEALQNVLKHARGATNVWIEVTQDRLLCFEVGDNGPGFNPNVQGGRGLRNMHDRLDAIGGHLNVESSPRDGTRISGAIDIA